MAIARRKIRGVKDIKTNLDRADQVVEPYKGYLRLGALEMERTRKLKERDNLRQRMEVIEERCRQLDAEKAMLLETINERAVDLGHREQIVPVAKKVHKKDYADCLPKKYQHSSAAEAKSKKTPSPSKGDAPLTAERPEMAAIARPTPPPMATSPAASGFKIRY